MSIPDSPDLPGSGPLPLPGLTPPAPSSLSEGAGTDGGEVEHGSLPLAPAAAFPRPAVRGNTRPSPFPLGDGRAPASRDGATAGAPPAPRSRPAPAAALARPGGGGLPAVVGTAGAARPPEDSRGGRAATSPPGGAEVRHPVPSGGSTGLSGKDAMDAVRRARSARTADRMRAKNLPAAARRAKNPFGNAGPGMARRMPPTPGDAA